MEEKEFIQTPENVTITYELAGLGSRFYAALIDVLIRGAITLILIIILLTSGFFSFKNFDLFSFKSFTTSLFISIFIIFIFLNLYFYFVFFEVLWNGQTPGKKVAKIRVIRDTGHPVNFFSSTLRNISRIVDFLPFYYGIGILSILLSKQNKRVGDYLAGTVIIKDKETFLPEIKTKEKPEKIISFNLRVEELTWQDYILIQKFLRRKNSLDEQARANIRKQILKEIVKKLELDFQDISAVDEEKFLEEVLYQYEQRRK
jgi:uncharacterized RDD family membrane protein YckC